MAVISYLYNDSFSHKELGVTVGGLNTDTINSAVNGRWDGQYGNVYATVSTVMIARIMIISQPLPVHIVPH